MNKEFFESLELLEKEKGIPKEEMMEKVENALLAAFRKENNGNENVRIKLDPEKSDVRMFVQLTVVEAVENPLTEIALDEARLHKKKIQLGDIYENEIKTKNFGRIAAQTAKQVIIQGIREAERGRMIREYEEKKEELITAVDVSDVRLGLAEKVGADETFKELPADLKFDKVIDAAGQPITLNTAIAHTRANGHLYVVSIFEKEFHFDINALVAAQITLVGCNVYTRKNLEDAVAAIASNKVDVGPLISRVFDIEECAQAFQLLNSRDKSVAKVLFKLS